MRTPTWSADGTCRGRSGPGADRSPGRCSFGLGSVRSCNFAGRGRSGGRSDRALTAFFGDFDRLGPVRDSRSIRTHRRLGCRLTSRLIVRHRSRLAGAGVSDGCSLRRSLAGRFALRLIGNRSGIFRVGRIRDVGTFFPRSSRARRRSRPAFGRRREFCHFLFVGLGRRIRPTGEECASLKKRIAQAKVLPRLTGFPSRTSAVSSLRPRLWSPESALYHPVGRRPVGVFSGFHRFR